MHRGMHREQKMRKKDNNLHEPISLKWCRLLCLFGGNGNEKETLNANRLL